MYVCICQGITEEDLTRVSQTSSSPKEIIKKLGVGDGCGICLLEAIEKLNVQTNTKAPPTKSLTRQKSV
jgi:bacterioferritin-associated ferredoxin